MPEHLLAPTDEVPARDGGRGPAGARPGEDQRGSNDPQRTPEIHPMPTSPARSGERPQGWFTGPTNSQHGPARSQQQPDPEAQKAAAQPVMHFALVMLAAIIAMNFPLPWQLASVAFAAVAFVLGIRALTRAWRANLRGFLLPIMVTSLLFMGLIGLRTMATVIWWEPIMTHQDCVRDALTIAAQEKCDSDFQQALTENNPLLNNSQLFGSGARAAGRSSVLPSP